MTVPAGTDDATGQPAGPNTPGPDASTLDRVFGRVLPDITRDEVRDRRDEFSDQWYLENRPPHHD